MKRASPCALLLALITCLAVAPALAIDSSFTYQGHLSDQGAPANGSYDLEFRLQDAFGLDLAAPLQRDAVPVSGGVFTVSLDFGEAPFDGEPRFLEIAVRRDGELDFTTLAPDVPITAAPYALRAQAADAAGFAGLAQDAAQLGGLLPSAFVQQDDARLSDARVPLPGSGSYIQNQFVFPQPGTSYWIDGTAAAGIVSAGTQYNLGGQRVLAIDNASVMLGPGTGANNQGGNQNVFVGVEAGLANTTGSFNSFVGLWAGRDNTSGIGNNFYGSETGRSTTTGCCNAFFGGSAGFANQDGSFNAFVGERSAQSMVTGNFNSTLGAHAVLADGLEYATAVGARAVVAQSHSLVLGAISGFGGATADTRVGIGTPTPQAALDVARGDVYISGAGQGVVLRSPDGLSCVRLVLTGGLSIVGELIPCP